MSAERLRGGRHGVDVERPQPEEARVLLGGGHGSISVRAATVFAREDGDRA